jgi:photosystem II stability/assembly factor-like uncharacterized protein
MKKFLTPIVLTLVLLMGAFSGQCQDVDAFIDGMSVRHIGPGAMSGRVTSIDVRRDRPNEILIGTASGGVWRSLSAGVTWEPLFDDEATQSIGAVKIASSNPDVIWVGTGEGNPRNSHTSGQGVYRSIDGGVSWNLMGLEETRNIHRIVIHPDNSQVVWVAALGPAWGEQEERGVFKTEDGGETWQKTLYVDNRTGVADLIIDPSNPDKLFAAMWTFDRKPWTFSSGSENSGLFVSHDGGVNWDELGEDEGLPSGEIGRIGLAISAANPDIVYALIESAKTGLYRSEDGGASWALVQSDDVGNRPFYYADIYVDPSDPDRLFNLYSMVDLSEDGGRSFETILPYHGVHPDHHAFYIHPDDPNYLIDGNDGGLNISRDGGKSWVFSNNLPLGQFYHISVDLDVPYNVYGGMQDNGSWMGPSAVFHGGGIRNQDWQEIMFGDGFDVVPAPGDLNTAYAMSQGGSVGRVDLRTGEITSIKPVRPDTTVLRFAWNAAIAADPHDPEGLYFASQFLHHSSDRGASWLTLSPDLTTNDTAKLHQAVSGGLTIDATQAENHCTILAIAPSPSDPSNVWVGTDDGRLQQTLDGGLTWTDHSQDIRHFPHGAWIPQIHISSHNDQEVYVVVNDYRRNDWRPYLYRTTNGGDSWVRLVMEGDVEGHVLCIVQDPVAPGLIFLGTEQGLYVSFDHGVNWRRWKNDIPTVPVRDLVIHPRDGDLIVGTFGRAVYIVDDLEPLRALATEGNAVLNEALRFFPVQPAYQAAYSRASGPRFEADMSWRGENKASGSRLRIYINPDTLAATKQDTLQLYILDSAGDTLRHTTFDPEEGLDQYAWHHGTNSSQWPSTKLQDSEDRNDRPGGGPSVLPGVYTAVVMLGDHRAEQAIPVRPDPRVPYDPAVREAQNEHERAVRRFSEAIAGDLQTIARGFAVIVVVRSECKHLPEEATEAVEALTDSLHAEFTRLNALYETPRDFEGYDHVTRRLSSVLWSAYSPNGGSAAPAGNAARALEVLREETAVFSAELGKVMTTLWPAWIEEVERVNRSPTAIFDAIGR